MRKQFSILSVALLLGLSVAYAAPQDQQAPPPENGQPRHRPMMDPAHQAKMLTKRLNLTEDQQKQLLPILTDQQQQMQSLHSDTSMSQADKRDKMRSIREDGQNKIKGILTDTQKQKYDEMQQQMRERMQGRRDASTPPANN